MNAMLTIPNWLMKRVQLTPNRLALHFNDEKISFNELYLRVTSTAERLYHGGIRKGDRVAVLLNNHVEMVVILHALQLIGSTAVLLNTRLQSEELLYQLQDSHSSFLISEEKLAEQWKPMIGNLQDYMIIENLPYMEKTSFPYVTEFDLQDICTMMYTSGTTGRPKGVLQTYGNHWSSAMGSVLNLGLQENDAWLTAVPLFHISGFSTLIRSALYGIPVILYEKFDERIINEALIEGKATIISVVSTMVQRMMNALGEQLYHPSFRCMLIGGGPVPLSLLETCKNKQIPVFQTYGLTETSSQIVTLAPEDSIRKLGSAGKPLFYSQIRIEKDGKISEPNQVGEIAVKGPNVTIGYYNREEANKKSFTSDGWFYTGDIGYLDEEGFLFVLDRRSDLIISGGENIYPSEIENVIGSHSKIKEVSVVGMNDSLWGQVPVAFYVVKDGENVSDQELEQFCRLHLANYKVPKKWMPIEELPKNASNKILRRVLKEQLED
ncbi:o-succinylbenzoate--CoA ligase [Bacillus andreraoultii]|uniref:o-succinylbenzoate--CoA ligase n=1 Tax=Bacillus andreraoultii TaxID=1499685 RepID=UPI0009E5F5A7|nr:o-succinylbenzoate--CoA ligase [Bacillus andreraoultii]